LDRVTPGALITVSVADAGAAFVAPSALVNAPAGIVLRCAPSVTLVTSTVIVQVAPAPTLPPESETPAPPGAAVTVPAPHVVDAFGVACDRHAGRKRIGERDARERDDPAARFETVIRSADVPPLTIDAGVNVLLSVTPAR